MLPRNPSFSEFDKRKGRGGREWERLKDLVCPPGSVCWLCGKVIRFDVPPRHPLSRSVDHVVALELGGHPTALANLRPAHYGCNSSKGIGTKSATRKRPRSRDY